MFVRKFFKKSSGQQQAPASSPDQGHLTAADLDIRVIAHHGIPSTASVLAFDSIQSLLAVGTLDGRIKVIGGDNIESILVSPKQSPFKNLEFIQNQGFLASISNDNEIQVWDLEWRRSASSLQWESNITAFSVIHGTSYMYIGDEYGMVSVLKYDIEAGKLIQLPYYVPMDTLAEAAAISSPIDHPVVGVLPQPCSQGNRLLIAFSNGLLVLWDASEDHVILVRGNKDAPVGKTVGDSQGGSQNELSDLDLSGKEITALCWTSTNGSVLAVGYVDGDILFWDFSDVSTVHMKTEKSSTSVVKLQLSSEDRRLPVIVMHWRQDISRSCGGKLFIYGGDVVGSEEVLTILSLDWSSGIQSLKCVGRVDLALDGSFADMVLSSVAGSTSGGTFLFLLTSPGNLQVLDDGSLASLTAKQDKKTVSPLKYPIVLPTMEPHITVTKLGLLCVKDDASRTLSETVSAAKTHVSTTLSENKKWPLTGGIHSELSSVENYQVEKLYIAGYEDGSVRIWDATYPVLSLIYVIASEVKGINVAASKASISALDLCTLTFCLVIGSECGMVRLYKLICHKGETSLSVITNSDKQVHVLHQEDGPRCIAVFSFSGYPVTTLRFADSGRKIAVGFKCGRVAVLDISTLSVLFLTDSIADSNCPISSLSILSFSDAPDSKNNPNCSESKILDVPEKLVVFAMTQDANIVLLDGDTGNMLGSCAKHPKDLTATSMYIIEGSHLISEVHGENHESSESNTSETGEVENRSSQANAPSVDMLCKDEPESTAETESSGKNSTNFLILVCCEDALCLYSVKSLSQGGVECIREVKLSNACCWTGVFKKDEEVSGLVVLYKTGTVEIRCLPKLEVVEVRSLVSLLRWNFKKNVDRTVCSTDRGHVAVINGPEFAILSLLAQENDFRLPESLPCLHDKVLAAAAEAALSQIPSPKKKQDGVPGILGGIIKGFRPNNVEQNVDRAWLCKNSSHLDTIFSNPPFLKPDHDAKEDEKIIELNIDDIIIDEPVTVSSSSDKGKKEKKDKGTERERLFEGASSAEQPRMRTVDEIKAKYRKAGDASAAASQAKDKLLERQEKLERLSQRTEELQSGAENFASMANELAKQMEKRKWWNI